MIYEVCLRGFAEYLEGMKMSIRCSGKEYTGSENLKKLVAEGYFGTITPAMKKMYLALDSLHIEVYFKKERFVLKKVEDETTPKDDVELLLGELEDPVYSAHDIPGYVFNFCVDASMICEYKDFQRVYDAIMNEMAASYSRFCSACCREVVEKRRKEDQGSDNGSEKWSCEFTPVPCSEW